jgi:hypothetical protein
MVKLFLGQKTKSLDLKRQIIFFFVDRYYFFFKKKKKKKKKVIIKEEGIDCIIICITLCRIVATNEKKLKHKTRRQLSGLNRRDGEKNR